MKIEKKVCPEYFQRIVDGTKKYELRLADWECSPGDTIVLREWNPEASQYTGREVEKRVTYVMKTKDLAFWSEKDINQHGFQIISFD